MEAVSTRAATARVRVVNGEALLLDGVLEVDGRTIEVRDAHLVDDDLDAVAELVRRIPIERTLVEVQLIDQAGASARLNRDAEAEVVATLLLEQTLDLQRRGIREADAVGDRCCVRDRLGRRGGESVSHGGSLKQRGLA